MRKHWYSINAVRPASPRGNVTIDYDPEEDVLLVSLSASDPAEEEKISIANSEMRIEKERNVVITINHSPERPWCISSIALTNASKHPLWADLFKGLEVALMGRKMMHFSVDPRRWELE